ncbi:MAG: hypothetical protein H6621_04890 [Halobacteriovoraceae bacterium]|nr:hypothetical protein [Halobacteriovoraceae bacterium]
MSESKKILKLVQDDRLQSVIEASELECVDSKEALQGTQVNYIVINNNKDLEKFSLSFEATAEGTELICFEMPKNIKDFLTLNGRVAISPKLLDQDIVQTLLTRYFKQEGNLYVDEMLLKNEIKTNNFKLTNHNKLGYYSDLIALDASKNDFHHVAIRNFLNQIAFYNFYLKKSDIADLPIEIESTFSNDVFVIQTSCTVNDFIAEYLLNAFSSVESTQQSPPNFLLTSCYLLSNFLSIGYNPKSKKLIFIGGWIKGQELDQHALFISQIHSSVKLVSEAKEKEEVYWNSIQQNNSDSTDITELPGDLLESLVDENEGDEYGEEITRVRGEVEKDEGFKKKLKENFSQDLAKKLAKQVRLKKVNDILAKKEEEIEEEQKVLGSLTEEEKQVVKGLGEVEDDTVQKVKGYMEEKLEDVINTVKGSLEKEEVQKISGKQLEDQFVRKIKSKKDLNKEELMIVKGLSENMANKVQDWHTESLTEEASESLNQVSSLVQKNKALMQLNFEKRLKEKMKEIGLANQPLTQEEFLEQNIQKQLENTLSETLEKDLDVKISTKNPVLENQTLVVKSLAKTLDADSEKVKKSISEQINKTKEKVNKEVSDRVFHPETKEKIEKDDEGLKEKFEKLNKLKNMQEGETLSSDEAKLIQELIDKDIANKEKLNEQLNENKKNKAEIKRQEAIFNTELDKIKRSVKAKDRIVEKAKLGMQTLSENKEKEIRALKGKIADLQNKELDKLSDGEYQEMLNKKDEEITALNLNLERHKSKLESLEDKIGDQKERISDLHVQTMKDAAVLGHEPTTRPEGRSDKSGFIKSQNDLARAREELQGLKQLINQAKVGEKNALIKSRDLEKHINELKKGNEELNQKLEEKMKENEIIHQDLVQLRNLQRQNVKDNSSTEDLAKQLEEEKANRKRAYSESREAIIKAQNQTMDLKKKAHGLEQEKLRLLAQVNELTKQLKVLQASAQTKEGAGSGDSAADKRQAQRLEQNLLIVKKDYSKAMFQLAEGKKEMNKLQTQNRGLANTVKSLEKELEKLKKNNKAA